ncbi:hypothetical protein K9L67_00470 [Candidatus Woesearchaeota archaeon]|nr:hypothetical protein [Candidatus Woesearchaeota archaeon]MCF7900680.1 hypothetical protein [Candidatus Woesearchaeota archaeon]MCF8013202.1 hypothetical protein [Candidatus Woesearchaeota archaeon]
MGLFDLAIDNLLENNNSGNFNLGPGLLLNFNFIKEINLIESYVEIDNKNMFLNNSDYEYMWLNLTSFPNIEKQDFDDLKHAKFSKNMMLFFDKDIGEEDVVFRFKNSDTSYLENYVKDKWLEYTSSIKDFFFSGILSAVKNKIINEVYRVNKIEKNLYAREFKEDFSGLESYVFDDIIIRGVAWKMISDSSEKIYKSTDPEFYLFKEHNSLSDSEIFKNIYNEYKEIHFAAKKAYMALEKFIN